MTDGYSIELETIGLDESVRAMAQFNDIAGDELTDALNKAMLLGERETKKVAPVLTGRLRSAIAGRVIGKGVAVEGVLAANIGSSGASYPYGWLLDKGSYEGKNGGTITLHYRRGPRAGSPTAGWFKQTLSEKSAAFTKYFRTATANIMKRLQELLP